MCRTDSILVSEFVIGYFVIRQRTSSSKLRCPTNCEGEFVFPSVLLTEWWQFQPCPIKIATCIVRARLRLAAIDPQIDKDIDVLFSYKSV